MKKTLAPTPPMGWNSWDCYGAGVTEEALREKKIALFSVKGFRSSMLMQVIYSKNRWVSPAMKAFIEMTKEFMPE